jgi:hypothetical protein
MIAGAERRARSAGAEPLPLAGLARADWRFLLPVPPEGGYRHLAVLGGPPGLPALLEESGLACRASRGLPPGQSVDAIAVLHGCGVPPWEAARGLAPGGVLYAEVEEPRLTAPFGLALRQALRRLRGLGLRPAGVWAVWPGFDRHQLAAPLHAPGALRWWAETLYPARTLRKRLVEAGLRRLDRRGAWLLTRCFALTATAGTGDGAPGDLPPLLLSHGAERAVLLPFSTSTARPATVLKVPRSAAFVAKTESEQELLARARGLAEEAARRAIPQPGGRVRWGTAVAARESYAPGVCLERSGVRWGRPLRGKIGDLRLAASWLTGFQAGAVVRRTAWGPRETAEWIEAPFDAFRRLAGASAREERLLAAALRHAGTLSGLPLPIVWRHRDFTPWNLFRDSGAGAALRVIDWEGLRPGPALCDLLHFITHWHEQVRRASCAASRRAALRELFLAQRPGRAAGAAREAVDGYCRRLGVDPRFVPLLLLHTWLEVVARCGETPVEAGPGVWESFDAGYVTFLAEAADALFGGPG